MRLLLTTDTIGGVWTYALDLARQLCGSGVEIALASMGGAPTPEQRRQAQAIDQLTLYPSCYKLEWMPNPWADVREAGHWLLDIERQFGPDLIHLNQYAHGGLAWRAPAIIVAHSCVCSWWQAVKGQPAPREWDRYRAVVRQGLRAVQRVAAPSSAMLDSIQAHYGPISRTCVVPNGRDGSMYRPQAKAPMIISAGRLWDEGKNIAALDRIAPRLAWAVYAAGDPAADHPLIHIEHLGRLDPASLADWLGRASIYALPARYEPFGLSVLEAALSRCALVLGNIPSLRETWSGAAVFADPNDDHAIASAIQSLIADDRLRNDLAGRAFNRARCYSARLMADAYLDLYSELCPAAGAAIDPAAAHDRSGAAPWALSQPS